jgi:hypothetical protein
MIDRGQKDASSQCQQIPKFQRGRPTGADSTCRIPADSSPGSVNERPGKAQSACVLPPPIAHRGTGITAPRLTQAVVPDETLTHIMPS